MNTNNLFYNPDIHGNFERNNDERKNNLIDLGQLIDNALLSKGLSRNALADMCEISRTEIVRIIEGKRIQPSIRNLYRISSVLGLNYIELLKLAGYLPVNNDFYSYAFPGLNSDQLTLISDIATELSNNQDFNEDDYNEIRKQLRMIILALRSK